MTPTDSRYDPDAPVRQMARRLFNESYNASRRKKRVAEIHIEHARLSISVLESYLDKDAIEGAFEHVDCARQRARDTIQNLTARIIEHEQSMKVSADEEAL